VGTVSANSLLGRQVWAYLDRTKQGGALNPAFGLWLMGFPTEWHGAGVSAMQSCRNSRQRSSSRVTKL
jgi:hypothetical protein